MLQTVNDNIVLVGDSKPFRWLDGWGPDVQKYVPDAGILTSSSELLGWTATETGTNTTVDSVSAGSLFTMTTGATDFNGYSSQLIGTAFAAVTGNPFYFGMKCSLSQATQSDFLCGLCGTDTTLTVASGGHAIGVGAGGFFFSKLDATTDIYFNVYSAGTSVSSTKVGTMTTGVREYEVYFDGNTVFAYIDGELVTSVGTGLPVTVATPSISVRNGASAATVLEVKWLKAIQVN